MSTYDHIWSEQTAANGYRELNPKFSKNRILNWNFGGITISENENNLRKSGLSTN